MCLIEEVTSYQIFGKLHANKEHAINAGIMEIADNLKRNHSNIPAGLIQNAEDLIYLLTEYRKIHPLPSAPAKPDEKEAWTLPPGHEFRSYEDIMGDILGARRKMGTVDRNAFDAWVVNERGYEDLDEFRRTATGSDHNRAADRLGIPITFDPDA